MDNGSRRNTRGRVFNMNPAASTFGGFVLTYLQRQYGAQPFAAKTLAALAKTSHRTAEKWVAGKSAPVGDNLMNLLVECEGFADEVFEYVQQKKASRGK